MSEQSLLQNREYIKALELSLAECHKEVLIVSAYLRSEVLSWIKDVIPEFVSVNIVTRWKPQDLVFGASDLESYEVARKQKWGFYIDQELHAKAVLVDSNILFLGSANLTSRGTHIFGYGNNELGIKIQASNDEVKKINQYFTNSYKLTLPMYLEMKSYINRLDNSKKEQALEWPNEIIDCVTSIVDGLWVDECFHSSPKEFFLDRFDENVNHDRNMLGTHDPNLTIIMQTKMVNWLKKIISECNQEFVTFGYITKKLHDAIITDPKPFRKDIKMLVSNMMDWVKFYNLYEMEYFQRTIAIKK